MNSKSDPRPEIAAVQRRFSRLFATNDIAGIAACYAEDAQMLVANMDAVHGRAAIESVFKFTAVPGHTLQFHTQELDVHGTSAVELGRYTRSRSDGSIFDRGKYIVIWKRIGDAWLIHRDMFSTSMANAAVLTPS